MQEGCSCKHNLFSNSLYPLLGRFLICLIFILAGIGKVIDFNGASDALKSLGVHGAKFYICISLIMELVGGFLLLLGRYTKVAICILMIVLFPITIVFHSFWKYSGPEMALQLSFFLKNLAIYGGLLAFYSYGPGSWSLDAYYAKKKNK